jgi:hypothetical protein
MRFMVMHKVDPRMEAGTPPDHELIQNMGKYIGQSAKSGVFLDGAGLHRSAQRVRLRFAGGKREIQRGPYEGGNELLASFAMIAARSMEHAIELASALAAATGDSEIEIGPVVEAWDLVGKPRPADAPFRFLLLSKADSAFEAGTANRGGAKQLLEQWKRDGILQSEAMLTPSSKGARYRSGNKREWVDGPFTESKELVAGYSIIDVPSLDDAKAWAVKYAAILTDGNEVDVRLVA